MKKLAVLLAILSLVGQAHAEKWNRGNDPRYFDAIAKNKMVTSFSDLPLAGKLQDERFGWSETYWPSNKGGIAYRWNHPNPQPFNFKLHSKEEIMRMSEAELSELSPAELYDIAMGDYKYSLTKKVLSKFSAKDLWWEGICHGWALAASNYPEPAPVVVRNKDGIRVPFGSSDVKGLLSMHDAYNSNGRYARVGDRCSVRGKVEGEESEEDGDISVPAKKDAERPECRDVNAGAFHVVLASMIGINSQGFVADVDRFNDVWNQPVTSYESRVLGTVKLSPLDLKNGVSTKLHVRTKMTYGEELVFFSAEEEALGTLGFVSKDPVTGTPAQTFRSKNYEYVLELDNTGNIVGGEWITETRPDMLWTKARDKSFRNGGFRGLPLEGLNSIYKPVRR